MRLRAAILRLVLALSTAVLAAGGMAVRAADGPAAGPTGTAAPTGSRDLSKFPGATLPTGIPAPAPVRKPPTGSTNGVSITWRRQPDSVDARIRRQPLSRVLAQVAKATGWQVFIEPGEDPAVSAVFRNLPARDALDRLLADHSHALLPGTNGRHRLIVFRSSATAASEEIAAEDDSRVENELVVQLGKDSKLTPEELARLTDGTVAGTLDGMGAARLRYADAAAADAARRKLDAMEGVDIDDNHRLPNVDSAGVLDGITSPGGLGIRPANVEKGRLVIGLIDSAVQSLGPDYDAFLIGRESVTGSQSGDPGLSHGTSMFANLVKAAEYTAGPQGGTANFGVLSVDVYGANESTTSFDVALGIQRAIQRGANVINLSLSSDVDSPFLHQLIQGYKNQGVLFLAAAGNDPVATPRFPAAYPEVLAVTAGNAGGQFAPYANRGQFVDLMLPGSGIVPFQGDQWLVTGTSTATAYASGIAGALWRPELGSPANLESVLRRDFGLRAP